MDKNNKIKYALLGMPHGTAVHQLRKLIMFSLIQELGKDVCYRCSEKINGVEDLSIEHKISWQLSTTPVETFFDLDNIAFSHLHCNCSAGKRKKKEPMKHGTQTRYSRYGCRCDACKKARSVYQKMYRRRIKQESVVKLVS